MKKKIVVGVSGGPDSMYLLDYLCQKNDFEIHVCHVNYHQRESSEYDQNIVFEYCKQHKLKFYLQEMFEKPMGNFQAFARDVRYQFFLKIYSEIDATGLYLGHHLDDFLETYQMQKRRNHFMYLGIKKENMVFGMKVFRPLIELTKQQILDDLAKKNIKYGIDETNFTDDYERNRVRSDLSKLSQYQKIDLYNKIVLENHKIENRINDLTKLLGEHLQLSIYLKLTEIEQKTLLSLWFLKHNEYINVTDSLIERLANINIDMQEKWISISKQKFLVAFNNKIILYDNDVSGYQFQINPNQTLLTPYFSLLNEKKGASIEIEIDICDFPITIRNFVNGDKMTLPFGTKKVNRIFIDNKVPKYQRQLWPIICNCDGQVIAIPGLIKNITKTSDFISVFMVK